MRFLFAGGGTFEGDLAMLRSRGVRYVVLSPGNAISELRAERHAFFATLPKSGIACISIGYNKVYDLGRPFPGRVPWMPVSARGAEICCCVGWRRWGDWRFANLPT